MKTLIAGFILLCLAATANPQTTNNVPALKGRAFAISKSGEVLPARMALVYLVRCEPEKRADGDDPDPCASFLAKRAERLKSCKGTKRNPAQAACEHDASVFAFMDAIFKPINVAKTAHFEDKQFETDEDGFFETNNSPGPLVMIYVSGQAGSHQCVWFEMIKLENGTTQIKLSKPFVQDYGI